MVRPHRLRVSGQTNCFSVESREGEGRDVNAIMSATSRTAGFVVAVALLALIPLISPARADSGVPIPAPAGTTWSIVAGYNTATHSVADQEDPHAIDIVRVPREETAFTSVLSPVDGTVAWRGWDGLSITDAAGFDHLLAHVAPLEHIGRGTRVVVGEPIAVVCAAYDCGNYGLPHIHYAIHRSLGNGFTGPSVPFVGDYAIEGRELHWRDEYNLHAGIEFTSTNVVGWTAPGVADSEDEPEVVEPEPGPVWTIPADAPAGGWRAVGVHQDTSVAGLFANLDAPLRELAVQDARSGGYERFDPDDAGSADVAVRSLQAGAAVWALVDADVPWLPAPPSGPRQVTIRLRAGLNLISWQGPDRSVAGALSNVAHLSHAFQYDPYTQSWRFWSRDMPAFLDTIDELSTGEALYVYVRVGSIWTQLP